MPEEVSNRELHEHLESIEKWERIQGLVALREIISEFEAYEKVMYNAANGDTKRAELADLSDVSTGTVSNRMSDWMTIGIIEKDGRLWKHVASLPEMGLEVPDIEKEG